MAFPTLTRRPALVSSEPEENKVTSDAEAGYEHRRKKFTKTRKFFKVTYDKLSTADRDAIMSHFDTVGEYTPFAWTDLEDNVWTVFYDKPPKFESFIPGWFTFDVLEFKEQ